MPDLIPKLDHIVYAVPDLEEGMRAFEERTGVSPVVGGSHPGWGTRNALVALDHGAYLEIIAPDPAQSVERYALGVDPNNPPRVTTWAIATTNIENPIEMERVRPDDVKLSWRLSDPFEDRMGGLIPFRIDWGNSPHPSETAPKGCELLGLTIFGPDMQSLQAQIGPVKSISLAEHDEPIIRVELLTPKGVITL